MKSESFTFKTSDGTNIFTYKWMPEEASSIRGIVQIAHGMAEHAGRYERFAEVLTKAEYALCMPTITGDTERPRAHKKKSVILLMKMAGEKP